jgi:CheY-like chemotaxis protein
LRIQYGNRAQLVIEAPLTGGTRASIRVPYAPDIFAGARNEPPYRPHRRRRRRHAPAAAQPPAGSWPALDIVAEAANGIEAVALAGQHQPDIVFLDIRMPGLSGIEAARMLFNRCHLVFVTAYDQYAIEAFEQGALDYLLKPVGGERLKTTCARLQTLIGQQPSNIERQLSQLLSHTASRPPSRNTCAGYRPWSAPTCA